MFIDFFLKIFAENQQSDAIIWDNRIYHYGWLRNQVDYWTKEIASYNIRKGDVVSLEADFSPNAVALLLALIEKGCVLVPLTTSVSMHKDQFLKIAQVKHFLSLGTDDVIYWEQLPGDVSHPIILSLQEKSHPGLILFSSGSTGNPKAAVHDLVPMLEKFKIPRQKKRMLTFLLFDHIGGINTLFYILSNGGCIITTQDRSPDTVLKAIEKYQVEILPTSPSFLNMVLLSGSYQQYNLSSLEKITYGTEVMPKSTLEKIHAILPTVTLQQTYGLSEVGILRSKSLSSDSLWVKIGGEGFKTRVVDGMLQIKANSAMIGYLNAPSPFTEDGWFMTGDEVEVNGDYFLIKGRKSEIINVGGQKVYPAEVESVIQEMEGVLDVIVKGESNSILGQIIVAKVSLDSMENVREFSLRMKKYCKGRLDSFKVPQKIGLENSVFHNSRFKKVRK